MADIYYRLPQLHQDAGSRDCWQIAASMLAGKSIVPRGLALRPPEQIHLGHGLYASTPGGGLLVTPENVSTLELNVQALADLYGLRVLPQEDRSNTLAWFAKTLQSGPVMIGGKFKNGAPHALVVNGINGDEIHVIDPASKGKAGWVRYELLLQTFPYATAIILQKPIDQRIAALASTRIPLLRTTGGLIGRAVGGGIAGGPLGAVAGGGPRLPPVRPPAPPGNRSARRLGGMLGGAVGAAVGGGSRGGMAGGAAGGVRVPPIRPPAAAGDRLARRMGGMLGGSVGGAMAGGPAGGMAAGIAGGVAGGVRVPTVHRPAPMGDRLARRVGGMLGTAVGGAMAGGPLGGVVAGAASVPPVRQPPMDDRSARRVGGMLGAAVGGAIAGGPLGGVAGASRRPPPPVGSLAWIGQGLH